MSDCFLDLQYAETDGTQLWVDLYLPDAAAPPLVVYIFGGGWQNGDRKRIDRFGLVPSLPDHGYAVASIDYRLSSVATFPAQIHDCKGAIRWLRAHADAYGYDPARIAVLGTSAGGHLAMLLGTTAGSDELEGEVGGHLDQSSRVQAVVDFFGPSDFVMRSGDQPHKTDDPEGSVYRLLGGAVSENKALAALASPVTHVSAGDPPLFVTHGTADETVLINQAERICDVYRETGLKVAYHPVAGAGHGGPEFKTPEIMAEVTRFLDEHL